jgi:tetratricopeptide (TPR) repeat protein
MVELRFLDAAGRVLGRREPRAADIEELARSTTKEYAVGSPHLAALGDDLYGLIGGLLDLQRDRAVHGVLLHIDAESRFRHLPWELLRRDGGFLCADPRRPFAPVRRAGRTRRSACAPARRPLRVLFMAAAPEGALPVLAFEHEEARILEATRAQGVELAVEESGTLRGLSERIGPDGGEPFDVLHLSGHAELRENGPCFLFEDELGRVSPVFASELARAFDAGWPRLVVLSACNTAAATDAGRLPSLCEKLVEAGAPAVLGWALAVGDRSATLAMTTLYERLARGTGIGAAIAAARCRLFEEKSAYWHMLRLYADATSLGPLVMPGANDGHRRRRARPTHTVFLDAGARMEVCPPDRFVGRRRPLQRCLRVLRSRNGGAENAAGVLIVGLGGLGKSSLAARLCDRMRPTHEPLVWVGKLDVPGFVRVTSAAIPEAAPILREDRPLSERLAAVFRGPLSARPVLFVFDDFEQNVGRGGARGGAIEVVEALIHALRATDAESRVIVTSRTARGFGGGERPALFREALESMNNADREKKLAQLGRLRPSRALPPALHDRALALAGGNPRLLEQLDALVAKQPRGLAVPARLVEQTIAAYQGAQRLRALLTGVPPACRTVLASMSLFELPVEREVLSFIAGDVNHQLDLAADVGLLEIGADPETGALRYAVPAVARPLLEADLPPGARAEVCTRAARQLHAVWWRTGETTEERALELHRLALRAGERAIACAMAATIAHEWYLRARYREAAAVCEATLALGEDHRVLHALARAEGACGETARAEAHFEAALARCPADEGRETLLERAALLHNTADLLAGRGEVDEASRRLHRALSLHERIGDPTSRANTLDRLASLLAQQGDVTGALRVWGEALDLHTRHGSDPERAATLSNLANLLAQRGEIDEARSHWDHALALQTRAGDRIGRAASLGGLAGILARAGRLPEAMERWTEARLIYQTTGDAEGEAATLNNMADALADTGRIREALVLWKQALASFERLGDLDGRATVRASLANVLAAQGRVSRAMRLWRQSLDDFERIGSVEGQATTRSNMASALLQMGRADEALALFGEALALHERSGDAEGMATARNNMAAVLLDRGAEDVERARVLLQEALAEFERIGDVDGQAATIGQIGLACDRAGQLDEAEARWTESLALHRRHGDASGAAAMLALLANAAWRRGEHDRERALYREAIAAHVSVRAWPDVAGLLEEIDGATAAETLSYRAQGFWLCVQVEVSADQSLRLAEALVAMLGLAAAAAPRLAATVSALVEAAGDDAPDATNLGRRCRELLRACAMARGVDEDRFRAWLIAEGLRRNKRVRAAAIEDLEGLVPEGRWLFERADVTELDGPISGAAVS